MKSGERTQETVASAREALEKRDLPPEMVERLYAWFVGKALDRGASPRIEDRVALFAIETGDAPAEPAVVSEDGAFTLPLRRVGKTQAGALFAAAATLPEGFGMRWLWRDEPKWIPLSRR